MKTGEIRDYVVRWLSLRPALILLTGIVGAILIADTGIGIALLIVACAALALLSCFIKGRGWKYLAFGALAGVCAFSIAKPQPLPGDYYYRESTYAGIALSCSQGRNSSSEIVEVTDSLGRRFRCRLAVMSADPVIAPGDTVVFRATLQPATDPDAVPGLQAYPFGDKADRISARATVSHHGIKVLGHSDALRFRPASWARALRGKIDSSPLSDNAAGLLSASLLGSSGGTPDAQEAFRAAGLAHLLCVSGFHVALIAGILAFFLLPMRLWTWGSRRRYFFIIPFIWLFVLLTGSNAPAVRAGIMLTIYLVAKGIERDQSTVNSLALAAAAILLLNPFSLYSVSFQLSVSAVVGLIGFAEALTPAYRRGRWLRLAVGTAATTVAATLGTLPVIAAAFHRIPLLSIPANVIVVPLFPLFICLGAASVILGTLGLPCGIFTTSANWLADFFTAVADSAVAMPGSVISDLYPTLAQTLLCAVAILLLISALRVKTKARFAFAAGSVLLLCIAFLSPGETYQPEFIFNRREVLVNYGTRAEMTFMHRAPRRPAATYWTFSPTYQNPFDNYLAAHRISPDSLRLNSSSIIHPALIVLDRNTSPDSLPSGKILYIHRTYHGTVAEIASMRPRQVILAENIPNGRRLDLMRGLYRLNLPVHDLSISPIRLPITEAQPENSGEE